MDPFSLELPINETEPNQLIWLKGEFLMLVISNTVYLLILMKSLNRLRSTKDWHFIFLILASSFALMNNTNDIYYRITAPDSSVVNCNKYFLKVFIFSATLNWVPISYYQISRLYRICVNYYKKNWYRGVVMVSASFSILYSVMYFLNLSNFTSNKNSFGGCSVSNNAKYTKYVELSDIVDTGFSLLVVIVTLFVSLKNLKRYKLRHLRIKSILDENLVLFFILVVSKTVLYTIIEKQATKPGGDIWWDGLSIIVLTCTYQLLNLKPKLNEKLEEPINQRNMKLFKNFPNMAMNDRSYDTDTNKRMKNLYRNSKGELNFPSLMKKDNAFNINQNHFIFSNNQYNNFINNDYELNRINNHQPNNINPYDRSSSKSSANPYTQIRSPISPFNNDQSPISPFNNIQSPTSPYNNIHSPVSPHNTLNQPNVNQRKKNKMANINMNPNYGMNSNLDEDFESNISSHSSFNNKNYINNSSYAMSSNHSYNSYINKNHYRF